MELLESELKKEAAEFAALQRSAAAEATGIKEKTQKFARQASIKIAYKETALAEQLHGALLLQQQQELQQQKEIEQTKQIIDRDAFVQEKTLEFLQTNIKQA